MLTLPLGLIKIDSTVSNKRSLGVMELKNKNSLSSKTP